MSCVPSINAFVATHSCHHEETEKDSSTEKPTHVEDKPEKVKKSWLGSIMGRFIYLGHDGSQTERSTTIMNKQNNSDWENEKMKFLRKQKVVNFVSERNLKDFYGGQIIFGRTRQDPLYFYLCDFQDQQMKRVDLAGSEEFSAQEKSPLAENNNIETKSGSIDILSRVRHLSGESVASSDSSTAPAASGRAEERTRHLSNPER